MAVFFDLSIYLDLDRQRSFRKNFKNRLDDAFIYEIDNIQYQYPYILAKYKNFPQYQSVSFVGTNWVQILLRYPKI